MRHIIFFIATLYWPSFWASDSPKETAQALKDHDRSVHLLDDWMRDPYPISHWPRMAGNI